jgi:hypothetical protein
MCLYDIICGDDYYKNKDIFLALDIVSILQLNEMREKIKEKLNDTKRRKTQACEYLSKKHLRG